MAVHFMGEDQSTACGQWSCNRFESTTEVSLVTCKRCLKSNYFQAEMEVSHAAAMVSSRRYGGINRE